MQPKENWNRDWTCATCKLHRRGHCAGHGHWVWMCTKMGIKKHGLKLCMSYTHSWNWGSERKVRIGLHAPRNESNIRNRSEHVGKIKSINWGVIRTNKYLYGLPSNKTPSSLNKGIRWECALAERFLENRSTRKCFVVNRVRAFKCRSSYCARKVPKTISSWVTQIKNWCPGRTSSSPKNVWMIHIFEKKSGDLTLRIYTSIYYIISYYITLHYIIS